MSVVLRHPRAQRVMLLCLDALSPAADCDAAPGSAPTWRDNAERLLTHARREGWSVAHGLARRPRPGEAPWRAAPGMAPRPLEPVYHRDAPSALANAELRQDVLGPPATELVLCGVSANGSALATALDAHGAGLALTLASDAVLLSGAEAAGLEGLRHLQTAGRLPGLVRSLPTTTVLGGWSHLRVVPGGRA